MEHIYQNQAYQTASPSKDREGIPMKTTAGGSSELTPQLPPRTTSLMPSNQHGSRQHTALNSKVEEENTHEADIERGSDPANSVKSMHIIWNLYSI